MVHRFVLPFIASIPEKSVRSIFLELENTPGTLVSALDVISGAGLNIVGVVSNIATSPEQSFYVILFIDMNGYTEEQIDNLLKLVEKKRGVRRLIMHKHIPEHTSIAPFYSELGIYDFRAIIITENELSELIDSLYKAFGTTGGQAFLYHLGIPLGKAEAKYFKKIMPNMGRTTPLEVIPMKSLGWCHDIEIEKLDEDTFKMKIYGLIECKILKERQIQSSSQLIRGFLAGFLSEIMNDEWEIEEQTCTALGAENCIFVAKRK